MNINDYRITAIKRLQYLGKYFSNQTTVMLSLTMNAFDKVVDNVEDCTVMTANMCALKPDGGRGL